MTSAWVGNIFAKLRASLWLIPSCMALSAIALSLATPYLDEHVSPRLIESIQWFSNMGPEGSITLLSTIAGSMITIAGVVFSVTIVALTLASSQFGPRLLDEFMRDRGNQLVLGTFVATFLYCLLMLPTIHLPQENGNTPYWGTFIGLLLAVASLGVLIYFVHHIAVSIQAPQLIAAVYADLEESMNRLFPERLGKGTGHETTPESPHQVEERLRQEGIDIPADTGGYLQAIETDLLVDLARKHQLVMLLHYRPGHFIIKDTPLVTVLAKDTVQPSLAKRLNRQFFCGVQRTHEQDLEFSVLQLVEVAVRALSPGLNDPFTCIQCIDRLSAMLCQLTRREFPSPYRYDQDHVLRIIAPPVTFQDMVNVAFHQIRHHGYAHMAVLIRLLESLERVGESIEREEDRKVIQHHVELIHHGSRKSLEDEFDREAIDIRCRRVLALLHPEKKPTALRHNI